MSATTEPKKTVERTLGADEMRYVRQAVHAYRNPVYVSSGTCRAFFAPKPEPPVNVPPRRTTDQVMFGVGRAAANTPRALVARKVTPSLATADPAPTLTSLHEGRQTAAVFVALALAAALWVGY